MKYLFFLFITILSVSESSCETYTNYTDAHSRTFQGFTLSNGLKVILIHDNEVTADAISLSVGVGSMQDPTEIQGLAHLIEHLVFSGESGNLLSLISSSGGYYNAETRKDKTEYQIITLRGNLKEILSKLRDEIFFPNFTATAYKNEAKIVDAEFRRKAAFTNVHMYRILELTSKEGHPFPSFTVGNFDTLWTKPTIKSIDVAAVAKSHHTKYYTPANMGLVILSGSDLDLNGMQSLVETVFLSVKSNDSAKDNLGKTLNPPWGTAELGTKIEVLAQASRTDYGCLVFPVPEEYKYMFDYFKLMLDGRYNGSFHQRLKSQGYINSQETVWTEFYKGFSAIMVCFNMVKSSFTKNDGILTEFFKFIAFLRSSGPSSTVWQDVQETRLVNLLHGSRGSSFDLVTDYGESILYSDPNVTVFRKTEGARQRLPFENDKISTLLEFVNPRNMRYLLATDAVNITNGYDDIYGVKFNYARVPLELLKNLETVTPYVGVVLPPQNKFIPKSFDLLPVTPFIQFAFTTPFLIQKTNISNAWYMQGWKYDEPKVYIKAKLFSPISKSTARDYVRSHVLAGMLAESLSFVKERLESFGSQLEISHKGFGLEISLYSYSDGINFVLEEIMNILCSEFLSKSTFKAGSELSLSDLLLGNQGTPCERAGVDQVIQEYGFTFPTLYREYAALKYSEMKGFIKSFFSKLRILWLFYGNVDKIDVRSMVDNADAKLIGFYKTQRFKSSDIRLKSRDVEIRKGIKTIFLKEGYSTDGTTCSLTYFQPDDAATAKAKTMLHILRNLIDEPFFNDMRGKQQLGYSVSINVRDDLNFGSSGIYLYVEGGYNPDFVEQRVMNFLQRFKSKLLLLTDKAFAKAKTSLLRRWGPHYPRLDLDALYYWSSISGEGSAYDYLGAKRVVLNLLGKEELFAFFDELFGLKNKTARQISIYVYNPETGIPVVSIPNGFSNESETSYNTTENKENPLKDLLRGPLTEVISFVNLTSWKQNQTLLPTFSYLEEMADPYDYQGSQEIDEDYHETTVSISTTERAISISTSSPTFSPTPTPTLIPSTNVEKRIIPWTWIELGVIGALLLVVASLFVYICTVRKRATMQV